MSVTESINQSLTPNQLRTQKARAAAVQARANVRAARCTAILAEIGWLALSPEAQAALGETMMERVRDAIDAAKTTGGVIRG